MRYDEVEPGQKVVINPAGSRRPAEGTVRAKEVVKVAGQDKEVIYVDGPRGRRLCAPSVLEPVS